jgi:hypothetical protein
MKSGTAGLFLLRRLTIATLIIIAIGGAAVWGRSWWKPQAIIAGSGRYSAGISLIRGGGRIHGPVVIRTDAWGWGGVDILDIDPGADRYIASLNKITTLAVAISLAIVAAGLWRRSRRARGFEVGQYEGICTTTHRAPHSEEAGLTQNAETRRFS